MKQKIKIYHREDEEYLIIVCPDGKIFRTTSYGYGSWSAKFQGTPCYCYDDEGTSYQISLICSYGKYPTQKAAIKAMKNYGSDVVLIGEL